jgi:hypothetical protein
MYIAGNDGTDLALAAEIRVEVDGTPGSNDMPGRILLRTTPDGSQAPVDAVKIDSAQNVTVSAGNLVIGTSGKGIDFSATPGTGTSELLADYEEGTWTPILGATSGNTGQTYSEQTGRYTKIGRTVIAEFTATLTDRGTLTGTAYIYNLPFVPAIAASVCELSFQNLNGNFVYVAGMVSTGGVIFPVTMTAAAASVTQPAGTAFWSNTTSIRGVVSYSV